MGAEVYHGEDVATDEHSAAYEFESLPFLTLLVVGMILIVFASSMFSSEDGIAFVE